MSEPQECELCGRKLKTPASRARGRGPVCDAKTRPPATPPAALPGMPGPGGRPAQTGPDLLDAADDDGPDQDGTR